ncbi:MAG: GntR family transcriptional regulator [Muribaculaceae bacterium]|nr:GntR family transcriptional regulator [Muribaculaceae bacterium]
MIKIGNFNTLKVLKIVDFGAYLDGGNNIEILLPSRYINIPLQIGDSINVFIYTDSEDRLIASTESPLIKVGEFAYLKVKQVTKFGAFVDWGLPKDLLVPFREQKTRMKEGEEYFVYAYLDDTTKRIVASSKIEKFLGNKFPCYKSGDAVEVIVYSKTDIGYKTVVDNLFQGMLYYNEIFQNINIGDKLNAFIKTIRSDGKIDLTLSDKAINRISILSDKIYNWIKAQGGETTICDKSSPEIIKDFFACSKKDFKKAIGLLYKEQRIEISDNWIKII